MIAPYLARLGITSGQACTLSLGLVLGGVLLATSVPPVWDRRAQVTATAASTTLAEDRPAALAVIESGYFTSPAGAAMSAAIPAAGLPIGARGGSPVELSYLRLAGDADKLLLAVSTANGASFGPDEPAVQACRILDVSWLPARPGPAVPYDGRACATGVRGADGSYSFDLSRFADRDDRRGFALIPLVDDSSRTFRLTLTASP